MGQRLLLPLRRVGGEQIVQRRGILRMLDVDDRFRRAAREHVAAELRHAHELLRRGAKRFERGLQVAAANQQVDVVDGAPIDRGVETVEKIESLESDRCDAGETLFVSQGFDRLQAGGADGRKQGAQ